MDLVYELQRIRAQLIREIDTSFELLLQQLKAEQERPEAAAEGTGDVESYESIYPLSAGPGIFKGRKPTGVVFKDGRRVDVPTWKKVAEEILRQCNADQSKHAALLSLRGKVSGRERVLLDKTKGTMRSPLQIDKNLYMETHYDTETLLRIMLTRILDAVGFDYSGISVAIRNE